MMTTYPVTNYKGILLRTRKSGGQGKVADIFTYSVGRIWVYIPQSVISKCGTGGTLPFTFLRFTVTGTGDHPVMMQYESEKILDMMALSYEDMQCWYYVIELAEELFPQEQENIEAYEVLKYGLLEAKAKNKMVAAFIIGVKLLLKAGFDPAEEGVMEESALSVPAQEFLKKCLLYRWGSGFNEAIKNKTFKEAAAYIDSFILKYCDVELKTKGAFSK